MSVFFKINLLSYPLSIPKVSILVSIYKIFHSCSSFILMENVLAFHIVDVSFVVHVVNEFIFYVF